MRILFLTHRLPYPPNRGDRIRAYHILKFLASRHEVHLVSLLHDDQERRHISSLSGFAASVEGAAVPALRNRITAIAALAGTRPLTHVLLSSPAFADGIRRSVARARPDVVLAFCTGIADAVFRPPLDEFPCVLDMVDVDSEKWAELSEHSAYPMKWIHRREARTLRAFEQRAVRRAAAAVVVSERERTLAERVLGGPIGVVPIGVDSEFWARPSGHETRPDVVFCGVFNYGPNERGAMWLASDVWPMVTQQEPEARLRLVGSYPSARVRALSMPGSIEVTGGVPDVRPHIWGASVAVAPLWLSRGTQNKVLEAVAGGLPCVVTPAVMEGLPAAVRGACTSAADAKAFADAIVTLLRRGSSESLRTEIRQHAAALDWTTQLSPLLPLLERARNGA